LRRLFVAALAVVLGAPALAHAGSGATIDGVVREVSEDGQSSYPSSGVTVEALLGGTSSQGSAVTPGAEFSFNVDVGEYHVTYAKSGFDTQCLPATATDGQITTMPTVTLLRVIHADSASGTVTNSLTGLPIENATVEAHISGSCMPPPTSLSTDATGAYNFASLPASVSYYFTFSAPGYNTQTIENQTLFDSPITVNAALEAVDSTPPEAAMAPAKVRRRKATVKFTAVDPPPATPPLTVTCQLDKEPAEPCEPPKVVYKGLDKGKHKVILVLTDGNANTATVKQRFKVE
jgi:hypothetical protein